MASGNFGTVTATAVVEFCPSLADRASFPAPSIGCSSYHTCESDRLRTTLWLPSHTCLIISPRMGSPHQPPGDNCRHNGVQHHNHVLYQQVGRYALTLSVISGYYSLGMVLTPCLSSCRTYAHDRQLLSSLEDSCHGRLPTHLNTKCAQYAFRAGMEQDSVGEAFRVPWTAGLLYLFSPFSLVQRALVTLCQHLAEAVIVALLWPC